MAISTTYTYDNASNFTFDSDDITLDDGTAKLKLQVADLPFTEDFADDTGFTYDSDYVEFSGGQVQQKDRTPSGSIAYWSFTTDEEADWTNGVAIGGGTLGGNAVISGGKLDLSATGSYFTFDGSNCKFARYGTIRFKLTALYDTAPSGSAYEVIGIRSTGANPDVNKILITHETNSRLSVRMNNSAGVSQTLFYGNFVPVNGTEYLIELDIDTQGTTRLFLNGTQIGSYTFSFDRTDSDLAGVVFNGGAGGREGLIKLDDLIIFDTVQHTSDHPGEVPFTYPSTAYSETALTLPEMEHTLPGDIQAGVSFATTESGATLGYSIDVGQSGVFKYWNGAAWVTSDGSYAQSCTAADFNTNFASLDVQGETYGQFKVHFPASNTQSSCSELTATMSVDTGYLTTNPDILTNSGVQMDDLISFAESINVTGSDTVTYTLSIGGQNYYHDGAEWTISDGTYAQSNTAAEIDTYSADFTEILGNGQTVKLRAFLHSHGEDGLTTPTLTSVTLEYDFYQEQTDTDMSTVYGYVLNNDVAVSGAVLTFRTSQAYLDSNNVIDVNTSTTTRSNGYFEIDLPKTSDAGVTLDVVIKYVDEQGWTKRREYTISVTAASAQELFEDLIV